MTSFIVIITLFTFYGANLSYLIYIHENMEKFFGLEPHEVTAIIIIPLSYMALLDDLKFLAPVSLVGIVFSAFFIIIVGIDLGEVISFKYFEEYIEETPLVIWETLPISVGILAFEYCAFVVLSVNI